MVKKKVFDRYAKRRERVKEQIKERKKHAESDTSVWANAPLPVSMTEFPRSYKTCQGNGLWEPYGKGKLCQQDPNARSGLRENRERNF